jgi:hypothetical protein
MLKVNEQQMRHTNYLKGSNNSSSSLTKTGGDIFRSPSADDFSVDESISASKPVYKFDSMASTTPPKGDQFQTDLKAMQDM